MAFTFIYSSGPIPLPLTAHSLDWVVLNNDSTAQKVRVTVFKCGIGSAKTQEPPGPLEVTIKPGHTTHNANGITGGLIYEIRVECSSKLIFPYASAWPSTVNNPMPGTVVNSADFIRTLA
jgi:hypothetical protein